MSSSQQPQELLEFKPVKADEIPRCYEMESSSYPSDEAATLESLTYRQENVFDEAFLGLYHNKTLIGYVCSTQCQSFEDASTMSTHDPKGRILAIHSVVIEESYRRRGYATQMLKYYMGEIQKVASNHNIETIMLLSKAKLLPLYIKCGFQVNRISPIVHGQESWYECECPIKSWVIPYWIVDAFTTEAGCGNPAAVVDMSQLEDGASSSTNIKSVEWRQMCAKEFNLAETAFIWNHPGTDANNTEHYDIRYYTNTGIEIPLCGHATLASATVLFSRYANYKTITFHTMNPNVTLLIENKSTSSISRCSMMFPWKDIQEFSKDSNSYQEGMGMLSKSFQTLFKEGDILFMGVGADDGGEDMFVDLSEKAFDNLPITEAIDFQPMIQSTLYQRGLMVCCQSNDSHGTEDSSMSIDFKSRFFGPKVGIMEDPVTGSAHCLLAPYFAKLFNKNHVIGQQMSSRRGIVECQVFENERKVQITGSAVMFMKGTLLV